MINEIVIKTGKSYSWSSSLGISNPFFISISLEGKRLLDDKAIVAQQERMRF